MPKKFNRPKEREEIFLPGEKEIPLSTIKVFAGESLTEGNWLVYDSLGMPREIKHENDRWIVVT